VHYALHGKAAFAEVPVAREFHVGKEVAILGVSLFVLGLGLGPLVAGPMSEIYGRNVVYRLSLALFFAFMFPVAFAPNIGKWLDGLIPPAYVVATFWRDARGQSYTSFSALCLGTAGPRFSAWPEEASVICSPIVKLPRALWLNSLLVSIGCLII
jgi:MFS family permease